MTKDAGLPTWANPDHLPRRSFCRSVRAIRRAFVRRDLARKSPTWGWFEAERIHASRGVVVTWQLPHNPITFAPRSLHDEHDPEDRVHVHHSRHRPGQIQERRLPRGFGDR